MGKTVKSMVDEAEAEIETLSVETVQSLLEDENAQIIDIRDIRELWSEGKIPGAYHAPRGMLEFWACPESPYHKDIFASGKKLVFYCAAAWRSALATKVMQDMGISPVAHLEGGFKAWKEAEAPIEPVEKK